MAAVSYTHLDVYKRQRRMLDTGEQVYDKETGQLRNCRGGDFVILMRSVRGLDQLYAEALRKMGAVSYTHLDVYKRQDQIYPAYRSGAAVSRNPRCFRGRWQVYVRLHHHRWHG